MVVPMSEPNDLPDETLAALLRGLADAVVVADPEGTIVFWNEAATRVFGWPADHAIGQSLDLIIPERFRARHWDGYEKVMATGVTSYGDRLLEVPALRRDGEPLSIAFTVTLLHGGNGEVTGIAAVVRDDTTRWNERREQRAEIARLRAAS
jgi:PAS domain S-box-containing protein